MSDKLLTRDGKPVTELGSWEKEQLKKLPKLVAEPKPIQSKKGRVPFDTVKHPNLFINRVNDGTDKACWVVKPTFRATKYPHKYFSDKVLGGKEKAYEQAVKHRDQVIAKLKEKFNVGKM